LKVVRQNVVTFWRAGFLVWERVFVDDQFLGDGWYSMSEDVWCGEMNMWEVDPGKGE
jgi:hypothetical protein